MQYFTQKDEKLVCLLCNHYCHLSPNQVGLCGVNKNSGSTIECLVYGHLAALNIDPVEKNRFITFCPILKRSLWEPLGAIFIVLFVKTGVFLKKNISITDTIILLRILYNRH